MAMRKYLRIRGEFQILPELKLLQTRFEFILFYFKCKLRKAIKLHKLLIGKRGIAVRANIITILSENKIAVF